MEENDIITEFFNRFDNNLSNVTDIEKISEQANIEGIRKLIEDWNNTKDDGLGYKFKSIGFKLQSLRRILINYGCDETKLPEIKI